MKYLPLDLEAFDYQKKDGAETFRVRVANSPVGEQRLADAETSTLPADLRKRLILLDKRTLELAETIELGLDLGNALFPPRARSFFDRSRDRLSDEQALRIRLRLDNYSLSDLPWEYSYLPNADTPANQRGTEGFLVLNRKISLVRYEVLGQPPGRITPGDGSFQMEVILANPESAEFPALDLEKEQRLIEEALKGVSQIQTQFHPNATVETLLDAVNAGADVLHFSGHGTFQTGMGENFGEVVGEGFVVLMGPDGKQQLFSSGKLALSLRGTAVRLVVLGSCEGGRRDGVNAWTGVAPALTRAGIPAVVGMQYKVLDKSAITFSRNFYRALAAGQEIDDAVTAARLAILTGTQDEKERDWGVPVLYLHAEDGVLFPRKDQKLPTTTPSPEIHVPLSPVITEGTKIDARALRNAMIPAFSVEDLKILCDDVEALMQEDNITEEFDLEMVGGSSKQAMILNLIEHLKRRKQLDYLVRAVRAARPEII